MFKVFINNFTLRKIHFWSNKIVLKMADYLNDGKVNKMDVDYSATVAEKIPECEKLARVILIDYPKFRIISAQSLPHMYMHSKLY